ncbi:MAG: MBL fold metallo-hydrolase [Thermoplasmata archaeon]|nr:MBL fold metallo-hydrolase [Thermoplasmata archaeon]
MKITSSVHMVGGSNLTSQMDCCVYLLEAKGKLILVDAGAGQDVKGLSDNIAEAGYDLSDIDILLLTHGHIDHIGGAWVVKKASGCEVVAHEGDKRAIEGYDCSKTAADVYGLEYRPVKVDRTIGDGEALIPGEQDGVLNAIHIPGHTPGSLALVYDPGGIEAKVLFAQDVHGPLSDEWGSNREEWQRSLARLLSVGADVLCEGHYGPIRSKERVESFIRGFL